MIMRAEAALGAPAELNVAWRRRCWHYRAGGEHARRYRLEEQGAAVEAYAQRLLAIRGGHKRMNNQPGLWTPCEIDPGMGTQPPVFEDPRIVETGIRQSSREAADCIRWAEAPHL